MHANTNLLHPFMVCYVESSVKSAMHCTTRLQRRSTTGIINNHHAWWSSCRWGWHSGYQLGLFLLDGITETEKIPYMVNKSLYSSDNWQFLIADVLMILYFHFITVCIILLVYIYVYDVTEHGVPGLELCVQSLHTKSKKPLKNVFKKAYR